MKKFFKHLSLAAMLCLGITLAACNGTDVPTGGSSTNPQTPTVNPTKPTETVKPTIKPTETAKPDENTISYEINVSAENCKPLKDFYVEIYKGKELVTDGFTGRDGKFVFQAEPYEYEVRVGDRDGYILNITSDHTNLMGDPVNFVCTTEVIEKEPKPNFRYEAGDVMYDFTLTDADNKTINLKDLIENQNKKVVILNFWAMWCGQCLGEFPSINEAYKSTNEAGKPYSDDVALIAVNAPMPGQTEDTPEVIKRFKEENNIAFDMYPDYKIGQKPNVQPALTTYFGLNAIPVTVIIDRYYNIAEIELGSVPDVNKWKLTFDQYSSDSYKPTYKPQGGGEGGEQEMVKPDIEMPSSDEIAKVVNGTNWDDSKFTTTYYPEKDSADAQYAWPFIVANDGNSIHPSNKAIDNSFAMMHFNINLRKGEVFTFDYHSSTEKDADSLFVLVDNLIVTSISGISDKHKYENCFAFPALREDEYKITLIYNKDGSGSQGDDTVYLKNFRILKTEDINKETYIYREGASGELDEFTQRYEHYITPVFNPADGYYHVDKVDGPLLLADLISGTNYNPAESLYEMAVKNTEKFIIDGVNYADVIAEYAVYCSASTLGYTPITKTLQEALEKVAMALSNDTSFQEQWIELTVYYNAYATKGNVELGSPIKGLTVFDYFELDEELGTATVDIDRIIQSLNGYMFRFQPTKAGVYNFYAKSTSMGAVDTELEVFDEAGRLLWSNDTRLRDFMIAYDNGKYSPYFTSYQYYESGKTYFIRPRFTDIFGMGKIEFCWEYVGMSYEKIAAASSPNFTTPEDLDQMQGDIEDNIISIGVPVALESDGYYHVVGSNAKDTRVFFDAKYLSELFGKNYEFLINPGKGHSAFDLRYDDLDGLRINEQGQWLKKAYEILEDGSKIEIIENGKYKYTTEVITDKLTGEPIVLTDVTDLVKVYVNSHMINNPGQPDDGLVPVDAEFARFLQAVVGKYTFEGVENSWLKLCYYYDYVGPKAK